MRSFLLRPLTRFAAAGFHLVREGQAVVDGKRYDAVIVPDREDLVRLVPTEETR